MTNPSNTDGLPKRLKTPKAGRGHHFQIRKNILEYDDVMNYQRQGVYELRRKALAGDGIEPLIDEAMGNVVADVMDECCQEGMHPEYWDVEGVRKRIDKVFGIQWEDTDNEIRDHSRDELRTQF